MYSINDIKENIKRIRKNIGHDDSEINIKDMIFNEKSNELWIITNDRPDKSVIIGKGGWVVGRLREDLNINKIHVDSYSDHILKKYKMNESLNKINSVIEDKNNNKNDKSNGLINLKKLLEIKIENSYNFDFKEHLKKNESEYDKNNHEAIVALSGGVDSSFSLVLAKFLGFNPIAITVDAGSIILPKHYKKNIDNLTKEIGVEHKYIKKDYSKIIHESLVQGRFHPCGRCSSKTGETLFNFGLENDIDTVIFGDMLATGSQCITNKILNYNGEKKKMYRLNLPASLSIAKQEIKQVIADYKVESIGGFGCPLLFEVHKKYPYMRKFSIQRILRETRSGALEAGEALNLIWSFAKK
ncbi:tRNA-specific 2-thiouridylase MnmA [Methanobrevibacter curvatus]|uniref:tRNA-specific 2-thiouridylase MnmA n=2 Tax=Methanobrevibacter curvatus TaxID=49547 RepID=A0A165Z2J0_9EURY|nr:7-cyano-7-deazaguanine synthase [Methanobrevibacter curvatus]KZX10169.1 tRNA-specific 2-thiouridylase MnmA [Methanobrevibacter curvatus]